MGALIPGKHQKLGVNQQQFGGSIFKVPTRVDSRTNRVQPLGRNRFDALFASGHEREGPERMSLAVGAMTRRFTAAAMGKCERAWKCVIGEVEAGHQQPRPTAEPRRVRTAGNRNAGFAVAHLLVIIPTDNDLNKTYGKCFCMIYRSVLIVPA